MLELDDHELEAACCRVYNDWLIDYCSARPDRLIGIAMLSMYDIDGAVKELERCRKAGCAVRSSGKYRPRAAVLLIAL
jgi:predicted TIM-barrel fold metal-dependent hydrolase